MSILSPDAAVDIIPDQILFRYKILFLFPIPFILICVPHSGQKRVLSATAVPQAGQCGLPAVICSCRVWAGRTAPQLGQHLRFAGAISLQAGHSFRCFVASPL